MQVLNHDLVGYVARLDRFAEEAHKSASSSVSEVNAFDIQRLKDYLGALKALKAHQESQPQLDLPESHQKFSYEVAEAIEAADVENESINDMLNLFKVLRFELLNSQSARLGSGWMVHDSKRCDSLIAKMESLIANYIEVATPLDLPESSPQEAVSGPGKLGI